MGAFKAAQLKAKVIWRGHGKSFLILCAIFLTVFGIYYLTNPGPTPYNSYVRLADAFLRGRLYLSEDVPWLELVPLDGRYYIIPPPMPALLVLPFVAIKGISFDQTLASIFLGSLNSVIFFLMIKKVLSKYGKKTNIMALWITALFSFGTIHWYLSSVGSVWYFGQITAVFFLLLSLNELFGKKRIWLVGLFLGAAYFSRLPVILSFPFFLIMLLRWRNENKKWKKIFNKENFSLIIQFSLGLGFFVGLNFLYNYFRFGTVFDVSYYLQPGVMNEPWYSKGYFNLAYLSEHLKIFLLKGPVFLPQFPYVQPSWMGMAIWITTPAFAYALNSPRDKLTIACWSAIIPTALLIMSHGGVGFSQFGYRYAMDFYPFLIILTAKGVAGRNISIKWHHMLLIGVGILVNLWGVLWINKFGWVGW